MSNIQDCKYFRRNKRKCDRCGFEYPERTDENSVTFFLCERCARHYNEIVDYYEYLRQQVTKQESEALWNFITRGEWNEKK